ncbi:MFS transporter [Comamonas composti]|uniref:MFS transporter n=1 Tax=Comamonas composti TaxID=408558 RepID=UPI0012EC7BC5|nr:MFS transporter [Comamonas composti]
MSEAAMKSENTEVDLQSLNTRVLKKIMPLLVMVYIMSFLDRTNIAMARKGMEADLGISAAAYGLGAGLFFLTYALFEIPSNLIMYRVGARFWITRIMLTWGAVTLATAFVWNEYSFYFMRLLLGVAEAGLFPGVMLYLTYWFESGERAKAIGYFLLGVCIANIIGGPLGGGLLSLEGLGGLHGWQWLLIIEGLMPMFLAFFVWKWLPDGPQSASWLTPQERQFYQSRQSSKEAVQDGHWWHMLKDGQIWLTIFVYFCHQIAIYTVIFFLPGIIASYGNLTSFEVGSLNSIPWVAASIGAVFILRTSKSPAKCRRILFFGLVTMALGLVLAAMLESSYGLIGYTITAFMVFVVQSVLFVFPATRLNGESLAAGLAFVTMAGLLGGFFGPSIMGLIEQATGNVKNGLFLISGLLLTASVVSIFLRQGQEESTVSG